MVRKVDLTLNQIQEHLCLNQTTSNPYIQKSHSHIEVYQKKSRQQDSMYDSENFSFKNEYRALDQSTFSHFQNKDDELKPIQVYDDTQSFLPSENDSNVIKLQRISQDEFISGQRTKTNIDMENFKKFG